MGFKKLRVKYDDRLISGNTFANQANIKTFCVGFKVKFFKFLKKEKKYQICELNMY